MRKKTTYNTTEKTNSTVITEEQSFNSSDANTHMNTRVRAMSKSCSGGSTKIKQHKHLNDGDQEGIKRTQSNNLQTTITGNLNQQQRLSAEEL